MTALLWLAAPFAAGCATGLAYFAGLWATVRTLPTARHPAITVLASYLLRLGAAAICFVLIARGGGWPWAAAALAGFLLARTAVVGRLPPSEIHPGGGRA